MRTSGCVIVQPSLPASSGGARLSGDRSVPPRSELSIIALDVSLEAVRGSAKRSRMCRRTYSLDAESFRTIPSVARDRMIAVPAAFAARTDGRRQVSIKN